MARWMPLGVLNGLNDLLSRWGLVENHVGYMEKAAHTCIFFYEDMFRNDSQRNIFDFYFNDNHLGNDDLSPADRQQRVSDLGNHVRRFYHEIDQAGGVDMGNFPIVLYQSPRNSANNIIKPFSKFKRFNLRRISEDSEEEKWNYLVEKLQKYLLELTARDIRNIRTRFGIGDEPNRFHDQLTPAQQLQYRP